MAPMFIPGPVDVADEVLAAQTKPMLPHRSKEFESLFQRAAERSKALFYTQSRVFLCASSGTGMHEAAVRNLVSGRMLSCVNGAFGERWYTVAETNGKQVDKLETEWSQPITADLVGEAVKGEDYDIVTIVHNETSTGLMNPVQEIAAAVHAVSPETLVCVDAVSSLGGVKLDMDAWGLDLVLTSSQKCLALPPGLALAAVNDRAMARAAGVPNRGWYFDFLRLEKHRLKDSTPATPAVSLIYALDCQLDRIEKEGLEKRFARHSENARLAQEWALGRGLKLYAGEGYRSQTVTAIDHGGEIDVAALNAFLKERDMRVASGYGPMKQTTLRIGHMGEIRPSDVEALLEAMEEWMD